MNSPQEILPSPEVGTTAQAPGHVSAPGTGAGALALKCLVTLPVGNLALLPLLVEREEQELLTSSL